MSERVKTEYGPSPAFTDGSYEPKSTAANIPKVSSYEQVRPSFDFSERGSTDRQDMKYRLPTGAVVALCGVCLIIGMALGTITSSVPDSSPVTGGAALIGLTEDSVTPETGNPRSRLLKPYEKEPYMGIVVQTVTDAVAEYYNRYTENSMVPGAQVYAVDSGACACMAGIERGDIIVAMGDTTVLSADDLTRAEGQFHAGDTVILTIFRSGTYQSVKLVLDERGPGAPQSRSDFFRDFEGLDEW